MMDQGIWASEQHMRRFCVISSGHDLKKCFLIDCVGATAQGQVWFQVFAVSYVSEYQVPSHLSLRTITARAVVKVLTRDQIFPYTRWAKCKTLSVIS